MKAVNILIFQLWVFNAWFNSLLDVTLSMLACGHE